MFQCAPRQKYGLLYIKDFEREKFLALSDADGDYSASMLISKSLKEDFDWWIRILSYQSQTNLIHTGQYACEIFSDASLSGWGAACGSSKLHGWWSREDRASHINLLELKAAFQALRCFASDLTDCNILLRIDNTTALSYINRFGSIQYPNLISIAKEIWKWCEERNIFLFASYIASAENVIADYESRIEEDDTEWSLSERGFSRILQEFGAFDIDLFASILNAKCELYTSWFPNPGSFVIDAFTFSWQTLYYYAFPPFILFSRVLRKIIDDEAVGVLVVPWWPSQPWFPLFCSLLIENPIILSPSYTLLSSPSSATQNGDPFPWLQGSYPEIV